MGLCLAWGCSDDDDNVMNTGEREGSYALFLKNELQVSGHAGTTMAVVQWSEAEWEISLGEGDLVTAVSPMSGGAATDLHQNVRLKIDYTVNGGREAKSQVLHLTNKTTGEVSDLTIRQGLAYETTALDIDASVRHQPVVGFGGMYNPKIWTGSNVLSTADMNTLYGPGGLGYSVLRLMIYPNEADWSTDVAAARLAQENGAIVFACPWVAPDALTELVKVGDNDVPHLKAENYAAYADHLVNYITYMRANGVNLYAISVQNEPDMEFMTWTPEELLTFVKQYGAKIRATGVKLMAPEACGTSPDFTDPFINDAEAFAQTDIVVGHLYQGFINTAQAGYEKDRHDYVCGLYSRIGGKTWWMTEHLFNDGETETDPALWQFRTWDYNLTHLGKEIHMCMEGYCSAYVYWYLKRFYGMLGDSDQRSPAGEGEVTKNGYNLAHYAQYATGMTRIGATSDNSSVMATAYTNEAGSEVTIVLLNLSTDTQSVEILLSGATVKEAVETDADRDMVPAETGKTDTGIYVMANANSIVSVRLAL